MNYATVNDLEKYVLLKTRQLDSNLLRFGQWMICV